MNKVKYDICQGNMLSVIQKRSLSLPNLLMPTVDTRNANNCYARTNKTAPEVTNGTSV